jgi:hypothetical protein
MTDTEKLKVAREFVKHVLDLADESFAEDDLAIWSDAVGDVHDDATQVLSKIGD